MTLRSDLRLALRGLRRAPLFAAVAILSLALGIGANAAIFTLLDQLLLRRLPVTSPDQLVMVYQDANNMGSNLGSRMNSFPLYQDLQERAEPFADVLCRRLVSASVSVGSADRARRGRARLRQLLHDAGREAGRRPRVQPRPGRTDRSTAIRSSS